MHPLIISDTQSGFALRQLSELLHTRYGVPDPDVILARGAIARCQQTHPEFVFVLHDTDADDQTLAVVQELREAHSGKLLVVGPATDPKFILRVIQAGADIYLDQSELESELEVAIRRVGSPRVGPRRTGRIFCVLSAAGGCGASTIAVNLATLLATAQGRCNLIDLNPGKADAGPLLDLKPRYTLADLCRNEDRLDGILYEKLLTAHTSGVSLLAAPHEHGDGRCVTDYGVAESLAIARTLFANVVVDLEDCVHAEQLVALNTATTIFIICRLDFTTIRRTRHVLDRLAAIGVHQDRIELVANQTGLANELPAMEAEAALRMKLSHFIPHDPDTMGWSNNTGIPAATREINAPVVQSIARLVGLDTRAVRPTGVLGRFRTYLCNVVTGVFKKRPVIKSGDLPQISEAEVGHEPVPA